MTALNPFFGYAKAAHIAKRALKENLSIEEVVLKEELMGKEELEKILSKAVTDSEK